MYATLKKAAARTGLTVLTGALAFGLWGAPTAAKVPVVEKTAPGAPIRLSVLGTYESRIFDQSAAEICAHDKKHQQLFIVKATRAALDVLNISDPDRPVLARSMDFSAYGTGINSVAVHDDLVAVAVEKETDKEKNRHNRGAAVITDLNGKTLGIFQVGYLPDMLTFTPDGTTLVVANEGEPTVGAANDPKGSVSLIDLSKGVDQAQVTTLDFSGFDARFKELANRGVRLYPFGASVAQDLEPEYIAVSPDNKTAYVALQENNALAVIDLDKKTVQDILSLGLKDWSRGRPALSLVPFRDLPPLPGQAPDADPIIRQGGFSSLWFKGEDDQGMYTFYTTPDRGPNKPVKKSDPPRTIFPVPGYQHRIVEFKTDPQNPAAGAWISGEILLTRQDGKTPITALPNIRHWQGEQQPLDRNGRLLADQYDAFGGDMEGMVVDKHQHFWLVDEYRPSIYHFDPDGRLIDRFVPKGTAALGKASAGEYGKEVLPGAYLKRKTNRGFEAAAYDPENHLVYAFIQSPLLNPDAKAGKASSVIRILGFDPVAGQPVSEHVYFLENSKHGLKKTDKIGDAAWIGNGELYVIERDATFNDREGKKYIFRINLKYATNVLGKTPDQLNGKTLEQLSPDEFAALGFTPVHKIKVGNLPSMGYCPSDKAEGIAILPGNCLAVLNDNDFSYDYKSNTLKDTREILGIIDFSAGNTVDVIKDKKPELVNQPFYGAYMPDAVAAYGIGHKTYIVSANEGDDRNDWYEGTAYRDAGKLGKTRLNPDYFPKGSAGDKLCHASSLRVSGIDGDLDQDGKFEHLVGYGARSFSIWDCFGNQTFDSGDDFERITADVLAGHFNTSNDNNKIENRTEKKGPEPEGIALGKIQGRWYAFIGLERIGGIMVYEITDPYAPVFVQYINRRDFTKDPEAGTKDGTAGDLGPEGLTFIRAEDSPSRTPLLVVCNEVSGTTTLFEIRDH